MMLVPAEVWTVARSEQGSAVLIRPVGSDIAVPIIIGQWEAHSIMIGISNHTVPRPLTHDLLLSTVKKFHSKVIRIEITDLKDRTFYGRLIITQNGKDVSIDARPSDCIALAVRVKCPIYIDESVVDEAGVSVNIINETSDKAILETPKEELSVLKEQLEKAVEDENYEEAAILRDKISEIEKGG
jgi:uncharacterized protein